MKLVFSFVALCICTSIFSQSGTQFISMFPHADKMKQYCVDIKEGRVENGQPLIAWEKNGQANQSFVYDKMSKQIRYASNKNFVLDAAISPIPAKEVASGDVILYQASSGSNQQWVLEAVPGETSFYIRNVYFNKYLIHQTSSSWGKAWKVILGSKGGQNSKWRLPDELQTSANTNTPKITVVKELKDVIGVQNNLGVAIIAYASYSKTHCLDVEGGNLANGGKVIVYEWKPFEKKPNQLFVFEGSVIRVKDRSLYLAIAGDGGIVLTSNKSTAATWVVEQYKRDGYFKIRHTGGRGYLGNKIKGDGWGGSGVWKCFVGNSGGDFKWTDGVVINQSLLSTLRANYLASNSVASSIETGIKASQLISLDGSGIILKRGNQLISGNGGTIVGTNSGNVIATGGANVIACGGANVIATGGANVIAVGGGNVIATGGANVVAMGGAN